LVGDWKFLGLTKGLIMWGKEAATNRKQKRKKIAKRSGGTLIAGGKKIREVASYLQPKTT